MASDTMEVKVHIYDLSKGMAKAMSMAFLGKQLNGIWHTGIVVYGQEFYFGGQGGIEACQPCGTMLGPPDTVHVVGQTQVPYDMFMDYLADQSQSTFRPDKYHLLEHNCNTFSSEVAQFLTGNDIPSYITSLPSDVLSTPFGQMIKPFIDSMSVQPSGGHAVFPGAQSSQSPMQNCSTQPPKPTQSAQTTGQSANSATKPSTTDLRPMKVSPLVFRQDIPKIESWKDDKFGLSQTELGVINEVYEYLQQTNNSWSLGGNHIQTLCLLIQRENCAECVTSVILLLQRLVLMEDIIQLLSHAKNTKFQNVFNHFTSYNDSQKEEVLKMICNCCSLAVGHKMLMTTNKSGDLCKSTVEICVSCLLSNNTHLCNRAAFVCFNISLFKVDEDIQVEIGSALLNCLDKKLDEPGAFHALYALNQFVKENQEVRGLASVLEVNFEPLKVLSDRVSSLCDSISTMLTPGVYKYF